MVLEKIMTPTWLQMLLSIAHSYSNYLVIIQVKDSLVVCNVS
jgi:hypothetical protein